MFTMSETVCLESSSLKLVFGKNGSLVGLLSKASGWQLIKRPELGLSWRMMLPLEGRRNNEAWGHMQEEPQCTQTQDAVRFVWNGIQSEHGGRHNVTVAATCRVAGGRAVFEMRIENGSSETVENVYYPYIGDLYRPEGCKRLDFWCNRYHGLTATSLWPVFENPLGTHSVDYPTLVENVHANNPPMNPCALLQGDAGSGLYLGAAEARAAAVTYHAEALPGWESSMEYRLFDADKTGDKEVYTRFGVGHLPFVAPGAVFDLLPFAMGGYKGGWDTGLACYLREGAQQNRRVAARVPAWAREPHAWLQVHINSPEDELRMKFSELPLLGEECAKHGIRALQLVGWNDGGQDRGNPSHSPDPRLGSYEELREAIQKIRAMGVKVILFAKFTWADQSREDFAEKYRQYAVKDPYGNYYVYGGYRYMTLSQVADVNTRRLIPMCFGSGEYREICNREFEKCLGLEPDGILYDESFHHEPSMVCFDESHGHRRGESVFAFDRTLIDGFREILGGREFLIAGEACYDAQFDYYDLSYTRTWGHGHKPNARLLRPDGQIMTAVIGFNDRNMINQCLLNRYIISYEPYNFKGLPSNFPLTVAYGQKMDRLRAELRHLFWDGAFRGTLGGSVRTAAGQPHPHYAVYEGEGGEKGLVVCNYADTALEVEAALEGGAALKHCRLVDDDDSRPVEKTVALPPRSAAVLY